MAGLSMKRIILIWIVVQCFTSVPLSEAEEGRDSSPSHARDDRKPCEGGMWGGGTAQGCNTAEIEELVKAQAANIAAAAACKNKSKCKPGCQVTAGSGGLVQPMASEAQAVWADGKKVLVDQLAEQIRDDEKAVRDGSYAMNSIQRCVESASAAGLEARQQAKIITLLTKNSKELIDHIDNVEHAATQDEVTTDVQLNAVKEKLQCLRKRISQAQEELVAIHECGVVKPLKPLRHVTPPVVVAALTRESLQKEVDLLPEGPIKRSLQKAMDDWPEATQVGAARLAKQSLLKAAFAGASGLAQRLSRIAADVGGAGLALPPDGAQEQEYRRELSMRAVDTTDPYVLTRRSLQEAVDRRAADTADPSVLTRQSLQKAVNTLPPGLVSSFLPNSVQKRSIGLPQQSVQTDGDVEPNGLTSSSQKTEEWGLAGLAGSKILNAIHSGTTELNRPSRRLNPYNAHVAPIGLTNPTKAVDMYSMGLSRLQPKTVNTRQVQRANKMLTDQYARLAGLTATMPNAMYPRQVKITKRMPNTMYTEQTRLGNTMPSNTYTRQPGIKNPIPFAMYTGESGNKNVMPLAMYNDQPELTKLMPKDMYTGSAGLANKMPNEYTEQARLTNVLPYSTYLGQAGLTSMTANATESMFKKRSLHKDAGGGPIGHTGWSQKAAEMRSPGLKGFSMPIAMAMGPVAFRMRLRRYNAATRPLRLRSSLQDGITRRWLQKEFDTRPAGRSSLRDGVYSDTPVAAYPSELSHKEVGTDEPYALTRRSSWNAGDTEEPIWRSRRYAHKGVDTNKLASENTGRLLRNAVDSKAATAENTQHWLQNPFNTEQPFMLSARSLHNPVDVEEPTERIQHSLKKMVDMVAPLVLTKRSAQQGVETAKPVMRIKRSLWIAAEMEKRSKQKAVDTAEGAQKAVSAEVTPTVH